MTWDGIVSVIMAILTFGISLAWPTDEQVPAAGTLTSTAFTRVDPALLDELRQAIGKCWATSPTTEDGVLVRIQVQLDPRGQVLSTKVLAPSGANLSRGAVASISAAERTVRDCQPYDLPDSAYEIWNTINVNFDPRSGPPPLAQ